MKKILTTTLLLVLLVGTPVAAEVISGEIYYGSVQQVNRDTVLLRYASPAGNVYFTCSLETTECSETKDANLYPQETTYGGWVVSEAGSYALEQFSFPGMTQTFWRLHSIEDQNLTDNQLIPYLTPGATATFSRNENVIVFSSGNDTLTRYDIPSRTQDTVTLSVPNYRLLSISPDGSRASAYSDTLGMHSVVEFDTGALARVPASSGSVLEFSENGEWAVFLGDNDNTHHLSLVDLRDISTPTTKVASVNTGTTVADYLFVGNILFYISNDASPLTWSLVKYDPQTGEKTVIEERVSYGDYIKEVNGNLLYLKVDGKVANIYRYNLETDTKEQLNTVPASPALDLSREEISIAEQTAALITPYNSEDETLPLIVWLHGGPRRQTSLEYHPYFSYAVYDELLENAANAGSRVLKLDYLGSYGYGKNYMEALTGQVGVADVEDVVDAIQEFRNEYPTNDIYVIGNSYGGYLALKATTDNPLLIDGTVAVNAVTDWFNLIARIPGSPFVQQFGGVPNDTTRPAYMRASVITNIDKLDSDPVVVVYGENDSTVPPRQSTEFGLLANALKKNVELVKLEGEEHVIRNRNSLIELCEKTASVFSLNLVCN